MKKMCIYMHTCFVACLIKKRYHRLAILYNVIYIIRISTDIMRAQATSW